MENTHNIRKCRAGKRIEDTTNGDTELKYRVLSIASYFVVLVLIGIPIWWYTTRVYRATLPLDEIRNLQLNNYSKREFGIPLSLEYDVLISFVHPDPENLQIKLTGLEIAEYLQDFLEELSPLADFITKSQWLYLTELGAIPKKVNNRLVLFEHQLPHVITPLETKLWSHMSARPSLNLVLYFPHCKAPLYIYNDNNEPSKTNAFVSPRWGGIYVINPDGNSCEKGQFKPNVNLIVATFKATLKELFKIQDDSIDGLKELRRRKTEELLESSKRTLKSLAQLLQEINSIVISDEVAEKINIAVKNVNDAASYISSNKSTNALASAKLAFKKSEEAFSHPSLLALLYFPDDQKYAIYIPLFLPVMIPVVMSLTSIGRKLKKVKCD
ncbi:GPI transamidase component PIG-S [Cylas formicarius]|uniref:GPI transamidase component PIG-S n=1 Tax=Cylas formicarius TaxID=197179 RepID=UPI002958A0A2|nr:GPI transamidase component PIG-S [Cylas formicarius]